MDVNSRSPGRILKIVVTGPFGAGKTSFIETVSEVTVLSTERPVSDVEPVRKANTTVAMDFGRISIDEELALYLFGTPGQRRFDFMWEILAEGMLGLVVLVDAEADDGIEEARHILDFFRDIGDVPYLVAVNKCDERPAQSVEVVRAALDIPDDVRVVACNALDRDSVKDALLELLTAVLEEIDGSEHAAAV